MKKIISILLLICLTLSLVACEKETEEETGLGDNLETQTQNNVAGNTFTNTSERFGNTDHATVWFGKDNSFVIRDNYLEGTYEIYGIYEIKEDVCTLKVEKSTHDEFEKIIFEVKDDNTVVLKTSILGSISGDTFCMDLGEAVIIEDTEYNVVGYYYNAGQKTRNSFGVSTVEFKEDGTFTLTDCEGMGAVLVEGLYSKENDVLMLSDFEQVVNNRFGEQVNNIEFFITEDGLIINEDLAGTHINDIFTKDGEAPKSWLDERFIDAYYTHEKIQDVNSDYLPKLILSNDGSFKYTENCYAGMANYYGHYEINDKSLKCYVDDNSELQGFAGQDVWEIDFNITDDYLILQTDLCMSRVGDKIYPLEG